MKAIATLPAVTIELGGARLEQEDALTLTHLRVLQGLSLSTACQLTFSNPSGLLQAAQDWPGISLEVRLGETGRTLFSGDVTGVEWHYGAANQRELVVRGYDRLHRLDKRQTVRAFVETTAQELATELTADLSLVVEAATSSPIWQRIVQHGQSDLQLLRQTALRSGHYFFLQDETLRLVTLEGLDDTLDLTLGDDLIEARFQVNSHSSCRSVAALGWDPWTAEAFGGESDVPRSGRRVSAEAAASDGGGNDQKTLVDRMAQSSAELESLAQAELDLRTASEVGVEGLAEGDVRLQPGMRVTVNHVAEGLEGRYVVSRVEHRIDSDRGFVSRFSTFPPRFERSETGPTWSLGLVDSIDDPEGLGRIRALLPSFNDIETGWLEVLSAGAGNGKGLVTLPDVGDRVLVLFNALDPAQGVILGGVYGLEGPPDSGIDDGQVARYTLMTPGGQRIQLDDGKRTLRLENSQGSFLEMTPQKVLLHCEGDLEIEAPARKVAIRGDQVDFQRA